MPDETAAVIVDGWLHTGDLVTVNDDDTYTFVARRKEVLRRRGENLSPPRSRTRSPSHPDVLEVAVVGVPSELSEEDVKAFVVPAPGAALDFAELRAWTGRRLSAFKVPRYWQAVEALAAHARPRGWPSTGCPERTRRGVRRRGSRAPGRTARCEEQVQVPLRQLAIAAHGAGVAAAEGPSAPGCRRRTRCSAGRSSISPGS